MKLIAKGWLPSPLCPYANKRDAAAAVGVYVYKEGGARKWREMRERDFDAGSSCFFFFCEVPRRRGYIRAFVVYGGVGVELDIL